MAYDVVIKGGRIVDGSGGPSFTGDVAVKDGRIVEIGRVSGAASRVIDADGLAVSPGFIDNHTHYDAQITWDPLCTSSCYHGVTTVVMGHCGLALAPARDGDQDVLAQMLSRIEAIPIEALRAGIRWNWETIPQYLDALEGKLGLNTAVMIGHSAVRRWAMGPAASERDATPDEIAAMRQVVREGMAAGAIGFSTNQNPNHLDFQGRPVPSVIAPESEIFELADALADVGAGVIQTSQPRALEKNARMSQALAERTGRPVVWLSVQQRWSDPDGWRRQLNLAEEGFRAGARAYPLSSPRRNNTRFNMKNCQVFDGLPAWRPVMLGTPEQKLAAFRDPAVRAKLHEESVTGTFETTFSRRWDMLFVTVPKLAKNQGLAGKSIAQIAAARGADVLDVFLDLAVEENLETGFEINLINGDEAAVATFLNSPYTLIGLSDAGAHVIFDAGYGFCTRLLGFWSREKGVISLEAAVRKLTFMNAQFYGFTDRGLLQPGFKADIAVFDPATVGAREPQLVRDLPGDCERLEQRADGVEYTLVNGQLLMEHGRATEALPGAVLRNAAYKGV
ncbi:MAG: amidohydrolase family protein [Chloroflexota bacterium]